MEPGRLQRQEAAESGTFAGKHSASVQPCLHYILEHANAPAMGFWSRTFTWWDGDTWGTRLFTWRRGEEVGKDDLGNVYYRSSKDPSRRWVVYDGSNDGSRVPPGWQAWLKGTIDGLPDKALPPERAFERRHVPNATGTMATFRPDGALGSGKIRPASTGDYQPWTPDRD